MEKQGQTRILVTGGAGFIGSHLVETLLAQNARVTVLDNFSTGKRENLIPFAGHKNFKLIVGDIRDMEKCREAVQDAEYVFHEAALGSVPRSIAHPEETIDVNIHGFTNVITAAKDAGVRRFVYASSSSVYGDNADPVKTESRTGVQLSPYAVSKICDEKIAGNFGRIFGMETIGLRYFNVFGPRQDPNGPYAAVIPLFIKALKAHTRPTIYGDGTNRRDFTFVANVVQANLLCLKAEAANDVFNVACGKSTSLNELFRLLSDRIFKTEPVYAAPRKGDIAFSLADISKAERLLKYKPQVLLAEGLDRMLGTAK